MLEDGFALFGGLNAVYWSWKLLCHQWRKLKDDIAVAKEWTA